MSRSRDALTEASDAFAAQISQRLAGLLREEAAARGGLLPFDRFMELALYAPGLGYYAAGARKFGPAGDFVTAPEVSPLFGRCVAEQCRELIRELGEADILELGAGSGALAADVLSALAGCSALPERYLILEPSPDLRQRQRRLLAERTPDQMGRVQWLDRLPVRFRGCVLANELLDAMPVHRFRVGPGGEPRELFVTPAGDRWDEIAAAPLSPGLEIAVRALQDRGLALGEGFESEINLRVGPWMQALVEALEQGIILLIDYGYPQSEYYSAERSKGTLMCHHRHRAQSDPYLQPGLQDITAHVDFSAVAEAASLAGLRLAGYTTQAHFLIGCGIDRLLSEVSTNGDGLQQILGARQLLLPSMMGERFHVIGFDKGMRLSWSGFSFRDLRHRLN